MNFARFNGGMFNGARVVAALALVTCTATASVSAEATYIHKSGSAISAVASIAANPFEYQFGSSSAFLGSANMVGTGKHTQATFCDVVGKATYRAYALRYTTSQAELGGSAEAIFIPASVFAFSDMVGGSSIYGEATKTHPGYGALEVVASVTPSEAVVYRMVLANIEGSVDWRVESGVNHVYDTYSDPTALSEVLIEDAGLVTKQVGALIYGVAYAESRATHIIKCQANMSATGEVGLQPVLIQSAQSTPGGSAELSATAEYHFQAEAMVSGVGTCSNVQALQKHLAHGSVNTPAAQIVAAPTVTLYGRSTVLATVACVGNLEYWFSLHGNPIGMVTLTAVPLVTHHWYGEVEIQASGGMSPIGYENLMAAMDPSRIFTRSQTVREFKRSESSRTFWK